MTKLELLLLVEDNAEDTKDMIALIHSVSPNISINSQTVSADALDWLRQANYIPQLILFDIGFRLDGIAFIKELRQIKGLSVVPLVIVTGLAKDIVDANAANIAAGYIIKPVEPDEFKTVITKLGFTT
jgi:two-component SAPR family response regulator